MKTLSLALSLLLITNAALFAQSGMTIKSGGAVTVNGNLIITTIPFVCGTPFTDNRDGKTYNTVQIGTQCWFAQNLNYGTRIDGVVEQTNNSVPEKYCYDNFEYNCNVYGGLYQWDEAMQYDSIEGVKGICPTGWHLPANSDWAVLTDLLGGLEIAGGEMKEAGYAHWGSPNTDATNSSGFTALPGGMRLDDGSFDGLANYAFFWSSSRGEGNWAWNHYLTYDGGYIGSGSSGYDYTPYGLSVRCVKE